MRERTKRSSRGSLELVFGKSAVETDHGARTGRTCRTRGLFELGRSFELNLDSTLLLYFPVSTAPRCGHAGRDCFRFNDQVHLSAAAARERPRYANLPSTKCAFEDHVPLANRSAEPSIHTEFHSQLANSLLRSVSPAYTSIRRRCATYADYDQSGLLRVIVSTFSGSGGVENWISNSHYQLPVVQSIELCLALHHCNCSASLHALMSPLLALSFRGYTWHALFSKSPVYHQRCPRIERKWRWRRLRPVILLGQLGDRRDM